MHDAGRTRSGGELEYYQIFISVAVQRSSECVASGPTNLRWVLKKKASKIRVWFLTWNVNSTAVCYTVVEYTTKIVLERRKQLLPTA